MTTLSFRRNNQITAQGLSAFAGLINLLKLDLERCPGIRGGLVHLKGLFLLKLLCPESELPLPSCWISSLFGVVRLVKKSGYTSIIDRRSLFKSNKLEEFPNLCDLLLT